MTPQRKPVTLGEIEAGLDLVARRMEKIGPRKAKLYLPIWRALTRERDKKLEADSMLQAARDRLSNGKSA